MRCPMLCSPVQSSGSRNDTNKAEADDARERNCNGISPRVKLSCCPNNIHKLWVEYEFGTGGWNPAKDFIVRERGACKFKYHRRKVVLE